MNRLQVYLSVQYITLGKGRWISQNNLCLTSLFVHVAKWVHSRIFLGFYYVLLRICFFFSITIMIFVSFQEFFVLFTRHHFIEFQSLYMYTIDWCVSLDVRRVYLSFDFESIFRSNLLHCEMRKKRANRDECNWEKKKKYAISSIGERLVDICEIVFVVDIFDVYTP